MEIQTRTIDGVTVVAVQGDIDGRSAPEVQSTLLPLCAGDTNVVLDMSKVAFMSSAGLRVLLAVYRQAASAQSRLVLVGLSEDLEDTMSATGFLDHFETYANLEAGIAAVQQKA